MPHQATRSTSKVLLSKAALPPLRRACYSRLEQGIEPLSEALIWANRTRSRKTWAVFAELARIGVLLDRAGWTDDDPRDGLTLDSTEDVALVLTLLREEMQDEGDQKAEALSEGSSRSAAQASRREMAAYEALTGLEAIAATAGLLDAKPGACTQRA